MKCAWAAESSRMKSSVQLGLLCLSLLISSLHGDEVETESSQEFSHPNFEEPDFHQLEMYRVRRQTVSTEENTAKRVAAVPSSENSKIKKKPPRPGGLSPVGVGLLGNPTIYINHRIKRQEKSRNKKQKIRLGSQSLLRPQKTEEVKRDAGGERLLPES